MLLLAVSAAEKFQQVPPSTWLKIGAAVLAVVLAVILVRRISKMNKVVMGVVVFVVCTILFFNWIYYRNEPAFMTPVINKIAPFFPSAGSYDTKQQQAPKT
jgi:drug/metabolite transporter (DMT)-like permease